MTSPGSKCFEDLDDDDDDDADVGGGAEREIETIELPFFIFYIIFCGHEIISPHSNNWQNYI